MRMTMLILLVRWKFLLDLCVISLMMEASENSEIVYIINCLRTYPSGYLECIAICPSIYLLTSISIFLPRYPSTYLYIYLLTFILCIPSIYLSIYLSTLCELTSFVSSELMVALNSRATSLRDNLKSIEAASLATSSRLTSLEPAIQVEDTIERISQRN